MKYAIDKTGHNTTKDVLGDMHAEFSHKFDWVVENIGEIYNKYATKKELAQQDWKCDSPFMKKVFNKIYVKYLIVRMDEYKSMQIHMTDVYVDHPGQANTIAGIRASLDYGMQYPCLVSGLCSG